MQTTSSNRFNFSNKRSRLVVTALAALSVFGPGLVNQAKAATFCTSGEGWSGCAVTGFRYDEVTFTADGITEQFKIRCDSQGWEYESKGGLTKAEANEFVEAYCDNRGYGAHN